MKKRVLCLVGAGLIGLAAAGILIVRPWSWRSLDLEKINSPSQITVIYDRNGAVAAGVGPENRTVLSGDEIPRQVRDAFVAIEDARFYDHFGIDLYRIGGALVSNLKSGSAREGASTITQQLVKLTHLSSEKTLARKAQEAWLAIRLEREMSKDDILCAYLNTVYFGAGAYGVEAAAQTYFGCGAAELTLAQAATLAGVIKSPSAYAPHLNAEKSLERRNLVLAQMAANGYITEEEKAAAQAEPLTLAMTDLSGQACWYADAVVEEACRVLDVTADQLMSGGYRIHTALNTAMQTSADALFAEESRFPGASADGAEPEAALVAMDCATGEILCLCGGRNYSVLRGFNRVTQMKRQPGSAFKPVSVYAAAIDLLGYTPVTLLDDTAREYSGYAPSNASGTSHGTVTLRQALVKSMNQATVNLLDSVGINAARLYAEKLGMALNDSDVSYALGLGSLTDGVSPAALCAAYCALGNGGYAVRPHLIRSIEDCDGQTVYESPESRTRALKAQTAYMLTDILRDTASYGTAKALSSLDFPVAAKTGTVGETDGGNRDAWTVAYTPALSVAVWMGYDEPEQHELAQGITGGSYPARLAAAFLADNAAFARAGEFARPDGMTSVLIDARTLKGDVASPMLAAENTPASCLMRETLPEGSVPRATSALWSFPARVDTVYVQEDEEGRPVISFVAPDSVSVWRVIRVSDGAESEAGRLEGKSGSFLSFTDTAADDSGDLAYYVAARQKYFEEQGEIVEAEPSDLVQFRRRTLFERVFGG